MMRRKCQGQSRCPVNVELRDLRWAVVTSQHRSLRQAAQALNVRQSTLSHRLWFIEDRLGAEQFLRSNGGTHPTVAGLEFPDTAKRILEDTSAAFRKLKARSRGETGQLSRLTSDGPAALRCGRAVRSYDVAV